MNQPEISLIICSYNRVKFVPTCLQSCLDQTLDSSRYEVLFINNNCNDGTTELVDRFIQDHPDLKIRQVVETQQGLSYARNRGIEEANAPIITYMDDDGVADPDLLENILNHFKSNPDTAGVGGKVIPIYESEEPRWYNPYLRMMVTKIDFGDKIFKAKGKRYPAGCNMTYKKELLIESGGFNNALKWRTDDKYIFNEVAKLNDNIFYLPQLRVQHHIDDVRITDENFDRLSRLLGSEERLRVKSDPNESFLAKCIEYIFKYKASILIAIGFALKGQWIKGRYTIRFRWLALKGLLDWK